jgi:predicted proteasome-type protease
MTYCVGILPDRGMVSASDSRTHAEWDNIAKFCKTTVFERPGDRVTVLSSSGNLVGTQAIISLLKQQWSDFARCWKIHGEGKAITVGFEQRLGAHAVRAAWLGEDHCGFGRDGISPTRALKVRQTPSARTAQSK